MRENRPEFNLKRQGVRGSINSAHVRQGEFALLGEAFAEAFVFGPGQFGVGGKEALGGRAGELH